MSVSKKPIGLKVFSILVRLTRIAGKVTLNVSGVFGAVGNAAKSFAITLSGALSNMSDAVGDVSHVSVI